MGEHVLTWIGPRHPDTGKVGWVASDVSTWPRNRLLEIRHEAVRQLSKLYGYEIAPDDCRLVPADFREVDQ